jgi:DNA repair exonuclease SbcCD nuclease subunit
LTTTDNTTLKRKPTTAEGEPRWEGSLAQAQLKKDVEEKYQVGKKPKELWEDNGENRESYRDYPLQVFRDHIYQEIRLRKWINFTIQERREKGLVLDDEDAEEESVVVRDDGIEVDYDGIAVVDGNDNLLDGDPPN